jgi:hypothetical protein
VVDLRHDRLARQSATIHIRTHREINLRCDDQFIAFRKVARRLAEDLFASARPIHVGCVKKVNTKLDRPFNERPALFLIQAPLSFFVESVTHAPEANSRYLEPGFSKIRVLH